MTIKALSYPSKAFYYQFYAIFTKVMLTVLTKNEQLKKKVFEIVSFY